jgi:hypothetical protein
MARKMGDTGQPWPRTRPPLVADVQRLDDDDDKQRVYAFYLSAAGVSPSGWTVFFHTKK